MKKNIFLSRNRRCINISTKKRGRKSKRGKRGKRGKNSKMSKMSKRVKTVNTNMRKNRTKKGRRNVQKGGVWVEVTQKKGEGNETYWYDLNKNGEDNDFYLNADYIKIPAKTWRKYKDASGRDYYVNDSRTESFWELPSPNPAFEPGYVSQSPSYVSQSPGYVSQSPSYTYPAHTVAPQPVTAQQQELSNISALLFQPTIQSTPHNFVGRLNDFKIKNPSFDISTTSFQSNTRSQTILYAACRTPYVSLDILKSLTAVFGCSPDVKTSDEFYPLGALISSLHDNVKSGEYLYGSLVAKYIEAIEILIKFSSKTEKIDLIEKKNKIGLTAYDDFAQLLLYNYIRDCSQLFKICKLLLINNNNNLRKRATVLFEACSQDNIYPGLIERLIECRNSEDSVSTKSLILYSNSEYNTYPPDFEKSGYPITALIQSYDRIKKAGRDLTNCKTAIGIVYRATDPSHMQSIESEYNTTIYNVQQIFGISI